MKYHEFRILFIQLELGHPTLPELSMYYGISERTLSRWKAKGFKVMRNKKFFYCEKCDEWSLTQHIHRKNYQNVTKAQLKENIINKYNERLKHCFNSLDKVVNI